MIYYSLKQCFYVLLHEFSLDDLFVYFSYYYSLAKTMIIFGAYQLIKQLYNRHFKMLILTSSRLI